MTDSPRLIDVNAQKSLFADFPFDIDHFHSGRPCGAFGGIAYALQFHWLAAAAYAFSATKKWARAHSDMRPASDEGSV
jgi:hypothetical protein